MSNRVWRSNRIQFPRLLAEIWAAGGLTGQQLIDVKESTDLTEDEIIELFERAVDEWDARKARIPMGTPVTEGQMRLGRAEVAVLVAEHYMDKFSRETGEDFRDKVWCHYDTGQRRYEIRGEALPAHPDQREQHPNGWSLLDHLSPTEARKIAAFARHRADDPHCTCNDCIAYHAATLAVKDRKA